MVGFHYKPLCFCGSDLQIGSQFLHVQDNIRGSGLRGRVDVLVFFARRGPPA